jgi:hypothetical protein
LRATAEKLERHAAWIALGVVMAIAFGLIMHAGRGTTFYLDDWPIALNRRDWTVYNLLRPHVDHLQLFPTLNEKVLLEVVGMHDYWIYRAQLAVLNVLTGVLLFVYGRKRIGAWPSLGLAACLVLMAPSWFNLLYAFQVNFVGATACGIGALLLLERRDRRGDVLACLLLVVGGASNGVGLPFVAAAFVELALRRETRRRLWVPVVPVVLYGIWRLIYGDEANSNVSLTNIRHVPAWLLDGLDDTASAVVGLPVEQGGSVWLVFLAIVVFALSRPGPPTPRLLALLALPITYWTITGIGRAGQGAGVQPDENRFLYPVAAMLALLVIEAAQHLRPNRRVVAAVSIVLLFAAALNANALERAGDEFRERSLPGKDGATALDLAGHLTGYDFPSADLTQPGPYLLVAGPYLEAVRDYGSSPGYTREELLRASDERKLGVDQALVRVHGTSVFGAPNDTPTLETPLNVPETDGARAEPADPGCVRFVPEREDAAAVVEVPWTGILIRAEDAEAEVRLRRFSRLWPDDELGKVAARGAALVKPAQPDKAPELFSAEVRSPGPVVVCTAR